MNETAFPVQHQRTTELAAVPTAVGQARRDVTQLLTEWELPELIDAAQLVVSELVTNAVQASALADTPAGGGDQAYAPRVQLQFQRLPAGLHVLVWDCDPHPPVLRHASKDAEGGRGLFLVKALSARWGHYWASYGGKVIWAEVIAE